MVKKLEQQIEEAQQLINELNNLDFKQKEEDSLFCENLNRLDNLFLELDGKPQILKPKTNKYLQ